MAAGGDPPGVAFDEGPHAAAAVVGGGADLKGEGFVGVVVDEVDLVLAVAPVVEADAGVQGQGSEGGCDEVLEE